MLKIIYRINIIYIYNNKNSNKLKDFLIIIILIPFLLNDHYENFYKIIQKMKISMHPYLKIVYKKNAELNTNFWLPKEILSNFFKEKINPLNLLKKINLTLH